MPSTGRSYFLWVVALILSGCSQTLDVIRQAESRVDQARSVDAPLHAPIHFADAERELALAKEYFAANNAQALPRAEAAINAANRAYEIASLGFHLERTRGELSRTRETAREEAARMTAEIARLEEERARLRAESARITEDRDRLRMAVETKNREIAEARAANEAMTREIAGLGDQIRELEDARLNLSADRERLTRTLKERTEELRSLGERGDALAAQLESLTSERAELERRLAERDQLLASAQADAASLQNEIAAREQALAEAQRDVNRLRDERTQTEQALADARAENERLGEEQRRAEAELAAANRRNREEMERIEKRSREIAETFSRYEEDLTAAQAELARREEELARIEKENVGLMADLKGLASEQIRLKEEAGRIVLTFVDKILFESGRAEIHPRGQEGLRHVARILTQHPERVIQIAGHTDTVPIATSKYPSNWELSSDRATKVLRFILEAEPSLEPRRFVAAGFGEFRPVASNDTPDGRTENRRVEIVILRGKFEGR